MRSTTKCILIALALWPGSLLATGIEVIEDNQNSLVIEATFSEWSTLPSPEGGKLLRSANVQLDERTGGPATPFLKRLIGLPGDARPKVIIEQAVWGDPIPGPVAAGFEATESADLPHLSTVGTVYLTVPARWRNRWTSELHIIPIRFEGSNAVPLERIRIRLEYGRHSASLRRGAVDRIADAALLNGETARSWTLPRRPLKTNTMSRAKASRSISSLWQQGTMVRIEIDSEGMYAIDQQDLDQLGIDMAGIDPRTLRLFGNGGAPLPVSFGLERDSALVENAILVTGEDDGSFDGSDRILFYGRAVNSWVPSTRTPGEYEHTVNPYVRRNVYWLFIPDAGGADGLRMSSLESENNPTAVAEYAHEHAFVDQDAILYANTSLDPQSGTNWYAAMLSEGQRYTVSLRIDNPIPGSEALLTVHFLEKESTTYIVEINGAPVDTVNYSSVNRYTTFDASRLHNGSNTISLRMLSGLSYVNSLELNWERLLIAVDGKMEFDKLSASGAVRVDLDEIENPWVFDIEEFNDVKYVRGESFVVDHVSNAPHRYLALEDDLFLTPYSMKVASVGGPEYPSGLREYSSGADYIIVTHSDFMQASAPLETYIEQRDTLEVLRVDVDDIYTEYGWGLLDPVAIRDFLADAYYRWENPPETVFFVGDGNYDPRNIYGNVETNYVPPYENGSYSYDDFYSAFTASTPELVSGRLPIQSSNALETYVEQLIQYESDPDYGPWRSQMVIVADDEYVATGVEDWNRKHMKDAERFARDQAPGYLDIKKIYLGPYPTEYDPVTGERRKPQATEDLISAVNDGTLLVAFMGHGNAHVWTHEDVLVDTRDDKLIDSGDRLPIYIAATCNWGYWDRPDNLSHPEILISRRGGAIAIIAATRKTYAGENSDFSAKFFAQFFSREAHHRIGEALMLAKLSSSYWSSIKTYHVLGEPRMVPALPKRDVAVTELDPDSLIAFGPATVTGQVASASSPLDPSFDGDVLLDVFDTVDTLVYTFGKESSRSSDESLEWTRPGGRLFRGLVSVEGGEFSGRFIVPRDVRLGTDGAQVRMYAFTPGVEGSGTLHGVSISRDVAELVDNTPPEINVFFDQSGWRSGDVTSSTPTLHIELFDTNGINLTGGIGHDILAVIDGDREIRLTDDFLYTRNSYSRGSAQRQLLDLEAGEHSMEVWAWDIANNFSREEVNFTVLSGSDEVVLANVLNWPNPFEKKTNFTFELSAPAEVTIRIFTPAGRLVREIGPVQANAGFNYPGNTSSALRWNGWDKYGDPVGNGVYLYKVVAEDENGRRDEVIGKLLRVR